MYRIELIIQDLTSCTLLDSMDSQTKLLSLQRDTVFFFTVLRIWCFQVIFVTCRPIAIFSTSFYFILDIQLLNTLTELNTERKVTFMLLPQASNFKALQLSERLLVFLDTYFLLELPIDNSTPPLIPPPSPSKHTKKDDSILVWEEMWKTGKRKTEMQ